MGLEAACTARFNGRRSGGKALLETDELVFRGDYRLSIPFADMESVVAEGERLAVRFSGGTAVFELGRHAPGWAERIRNPKTLIDKLGVRPGWKVAVLNMADELFAKDVEDASGRRPLRRAGNDCDAIFFGARSEAELSRIERLRTSLKPDGALWVVRPKGIAAITEAAVIGAGRRAGLVDVKVVRFSETHTAEKFVIPTGERA